MNETVAKLAGLSLLLILVWIAVYWLTPAGPRVTFADLEAPKEPGAETNPPQREPAPRASNSDRPIPVEPKPETKHRPEPKPQPAESVQRPEQKEPVAVVPPEFIEHEVQKNETFDSIAKKYFGPKASGAIIARANPFVDPLRLRPGRTLRVPKDPKNIQGVPVKEPSNEPRKSTSAGTYTVQPGDTLSKIASKVYGDSRKADVIFDANKHQLADVDSLTIGQVLVIPEQKPE